MYSLVGVNWHRYEGTTRWHLPHLAAASPEPWHVVRCRNQGRLSRVSGKSKERSLRKHSSCDVTARLPNQNIMAVSMHAHLAASLGCKSLRSALLHAPRDDCRALPILMQRTSLLVREVIVSMQVPLYQSNSTRLHVAPYRQICDTI